MKKPSLQFYPGDWRKDPSVNCLSLAARGLWFEMLMLMHESPRRGYLKMTHQQLARVVGATASEVRNRLGELQFCGTFSLDEEGYMFNRRMVRDEEISASRSKAGSSGADKRWNLPQICHDDDDGKSENLPLPKEVEDEVEVEITEEILEMDVVEIFCMLDALYTAAGLPIPPRHKQFCMQMLVSIPSGKRMRVPRYVQHMLDTGRWSSAAKTKSLKNLLTDGDWDVPIIERTIPVPGQNGKARTIGLSRDEREAKQASELTKLESDAAPWLAQNPGKTLSDFVDWNLSQKETA